MQGKTERSLSGFDRFLACGVLDLCGNWAISFSDDDERPRSERAIPCDIPGGIHTALMSAGLLGNISEERNFVDAMNWEGKHKWLQRTFDWSLPEQKDPIWLVFEGVDPQCEIFLN